ncbi:MAG TPA: hypothetical protein VGN88_08975 [Phycisphaerae bacterium]|jgi:hypothetical protein
MVSVLAVVSASLLAHGQSASNETPPPIEGATLVSRDPLEASKYLGSVYKMESEGFSLTPPAGSRMIERRGIDLVSFVVDQKSWGGSLQLIDLGQAAVFDSSTASRPAAPRPQKTVSMGIQDYIANNKSQLNNTFKGVQVTQEKYFRRDSKPAVRFDITMQAVLGGLISGGQASAMTRGPTTRPADLAQIGSGVVSLMRQQLIIQSQSDEFGKGTQFLTLTFYAPLKDREAATRTFELMLNEFELFDPATLRKRRGDAIALGKTWLAQQSAETFRKKMIAEPQLFRIIVDGNDVGYIRFDEMTQEPNPKAGGMIDVERDERKGVLMQINHRAFPPDGGVIYGQNDAFWAYNKGTKGENLSNYSLWNNIAKTHARVATARGGMPMVQDVLPWTQETGIIRQITKPNEFIVALSGDPTQRLPAGINTIINVDQPDPLPKILEYSWTRFVDLAKPAEMSFIVYDSKAKKLALRTLIVTGKKEIVTIDGRAITCFRCVDELDPNSTTLWVDATGRIQMMQTSDQSIMIPTTEAAMKLKWGARINEQ